MIRNRRPEYLREFEEPERVFYGNVCNKCFSKVNLTKCIGCKQVQYCCIEHKQEDLQFHSRVCSVLAGYGFSAEIDTPKKFFFERWSMYIKMRQHLDPNPLTRYDREIVLVPWVCIICYKSEGLNYGCETCESVAYCSIEHQKQDEEKHKEICVRLHLCRVFSSLGYQYGWKIKPIDFKYEPIRQKERRFPTEMKDLLKLLQRQLRTPSDDSEAINAGIFTDRYAAAATILSCLETIGVITNRKYNWLPNKNLYQVVDFKPRTKNSNVKMSAQFVIHMVAAYDYEMQIPWVNFVGLILDWVKNIHFVKIILVGTGLHQFTGFDFSSIQHIASYECYASKYKDVIHQLETPDVIVLHNFGYPNMSCLEEFLEADTKNSLFRFSGVPVILTAAFPFFLTQITTTYADFKEVEVVSSLRTNQFCECSSLRFWGNEALQCSHHNEYVGVYRRK